MEASKTAITVEKPVMATSPNVDSKRLIELFARHLLERNSLTRDQLAVALRLMSEIDVRIGQLATLKGFMTIGDVYYVLSDRQTMEMHFGELAIKNGFMTKDQVRDLLDIQSDSFQIFLHSLLLTRVATQPMLSKLLADFTKSHGLSLTLDLLKETTRASTGGLAGDGTSDLNAASDLRGRESAMWKTLRQVKSMASLPVVVSRILDLTSNLEVNSKEVIHAVQSDPGLTAQLLRVANSAYFGMRNKATQIDRVFVSLGIMGVRQVVLTSTLLNKFKDMDLPEAQNLWKDSIWTAHWGRTLAMHKGLKEIAEDAFMAGLLHNVGTVVVMQYFPEQKNQIDKLVAGGLVVEAAEREVLGATRAEIGSYLCHFWGFPESLVETIRYHEADPAQLRTLGKSLPLVNMVNAARRLAKVSWGIDPAQAAAELPDDFVLFHQLNREELPGLAEKVKQTSEGMIQLFLG